jgi:hypothetical protein
VWALVIIALLYGCSSVVVCCSEAAKVQTDPALKVERVGGSMTEDVLNEAIHHTVGDDPKDPKAILRGTEDAK